jgi:hypothetical protein
MFKLIAQISLYIVNSFFAVGHPRGGIENGKHSHSDHLTFLNCQWA